MKYCTFSSTNTFEDTAKIEFVYSNTLCRNLVISNKNANNEKIQFLAISQN